MSGLAPLTWRDVGHASGAESGNGVEEVNWSLGGPK